MFEKETKLKRCLFLGFLILAGLSLFSFSSAEENAQNNLKIFYEGALTDAEGSLVPDGRYNIRFTIWDEKSGGNILWQESKLYYEAPYVKQGKINVVLGRENLLSLDLSEAPFWMGIEIGEETEEGISWDEEIKPRKEINTLSNLLEGEDLTVESWQEVEEMLQSRLESEGEVIVLMDIRDFGDFEEEGGLNTQFIRTFKRFIDFLSEKIVVIETRLNNVLLKLDNMVGMLSDMKDKIDALYATVVLKEEFDSRELEKDKGDSSVSTSDSGLDPKDKGRGMIPEGEKTIKIFSSVLKKDSKIFVTFLERPGANWWISQKKEGEFFVIQFGEAVEEDLEFDYWVVEGEALERDEEQNGEDQEPTGTQEGETSQDEDEGLEMDEKEESQGSGSDHESQEEELPSTEKEESEGGEEKPDVGDDTDSSDDDSSDDGSEDNVEEKSEEPGADDNTDSSGDDSSDDSSENNLEED